VTVSPLFRGRSRSRRLRLLVSSRLAMASDYLHSSRLDRPYDWHYLGAPRVMNSGAECEILRRASATKWIRRLKPIVLAVSLGLVIYVAAFVWNFEMLSNPVRDNKHGWLGPATRGDSHVVDIGKSIITKAKISLFTDDIVHCARSGYGSWAFEA
jgi:hypothetical protein